MMRHYLARAGAFLLPALLAAAPAAAQGQMNLIDAGQALATRVGAATGFANVPMLTNADAALVRAAFDADAVRKTPLDLDTISNSCIAVGTAIVAYTAFAARTGDAETALLRLQDEVTLGAVAGNLCAQRGFHAVSAVVDAMPEAARGRVQGPLKQMRDGAEQTIMGTLQAATAKPLRAKNRTAMLAAILEDAPMVAASFPAAERARVRQLILGTQAGMPVADRKTVAAIAAAFAAPACNVLCKVASAD
jgi:hypothetical protein